MPVLNYPDALKTLLLNGRVRSHPALDITLTNGAQLHYSTVNVEFGGDVYVPRVKTVSSMKTSVTKSVDRCDVVLLNGDGLVGQVFTADGALDNAQCLYSKIFINLDNPAEQYKVEKMFGFLSVEDPDDMDTVVALKLTSDTYAAGSVAGEYEVSSDCVWRYKDPYTCGYSGALPDCTLTYDGVNGCTTHFPQPDEAKGHFGGAGLFLDAQTVAELTPYVNGGDVGEFDDIPPRYRPRGAQPRTPQRPD